MKSEKVSVKKTIEADSKRNVTINKEEGPEEQLRGW